MPSPWVTRFAGLIPPGPVLDLAAGAGRHARYLLERARAVTCVDREVAGLADLAGRAGLEIVAADLEGGAAWPLERKEASTVSPRCSCRSEWCSRACSRAHSANVTDRRFRDAAHRTS